MSGKNLCKFMQCPRMTVQNFLAKQQIHLPKVRFLPSHLVKQVTADDNSLVFSSLSNKVTAFLCCFTVQKKTGPVFFANLCSPTGSIIVTSCTLNICESLPNLPVLRIQGEHWREGELLLTYTKGEGELNINQKVFNRAGKSAKL